MISIGIRTIARNTKKMPLPVLFILDEFGTIGKLSAVAQAFGLMAGLQMCVWAFVQDLVQLKRDYPDDWETFISNSAAITCFRVMDNTTTTYISAMLGQTTVEQASDASEYVRRVTSNKNFATDQDRPNARPLMTPDEVRRLNKTWGLFITNEGPSFFEKIRYFAEPRFAALARKNPLEATTQSEENGESLPLELSTPVVSPKLRGPAKTNIELQLAAFHEQVLKPIEMKAKEPLGWISSPPQRYLIYFLVSLIPGAAGPLINPNNSENIIFYARQNLPKLKEIETTALEQNAKMREYGLDDPEGFGYNEANRKDQETNIRSMKAVIRRNWARIHAYEKENGIEVIEKAQAKELEDVPSL